MGLKRLQGAAWALRLKHLLQPALAVCLASAAALAALQAGAQGAPVPPGEDDPNYYDRDSDGVPDNEDKCPDEKGPASNDGCVPTIVVIGAGFVVCPGGMVVSVKQNCSRYGLWAGHYRPARWSTDTGIVNGDNGWTPCVAGQVDSQCTCGSGKVKVYDDGNDTFHCKIEPPAAGCPLWGQTFDFDLKVWECVVMPLDRSSLDKIKHCLAGTVVDTYWDSSKIKIVTNTLDYGGALLAPDGSLDRLEIDLWQSLNMFEMCHQ